MVRVLARPRRIEREDELGYLLRALRNTWSDTLRTRSRRPVTAAMPEDFEHADALQRAPRPRPRRGQRGARRGRPAPSTYRDAIVLVDVAGLTYTEAAKELGVPARHDHEPPLARALRGRAAARRRRRLAVPVRAAFRDDRSAATREARASDSFARCVAPLLALLAVAGVGRRRHRARPVGSTDPYSQPEPRRHRRRVIRPRVRRRLPHDRRLLVRFSPPTGAVFGWLEVSVRGHRVGAHDRRSRAPRASRSAPARRLARARARGDARRAADPHVPDVHVLRRAAVDGRWRTDPAGWWED